MNKTIGKLARLSAIYMLGDVIARGVAFLLLPIYMQYLSPAEYGIIGVAETIKQILIVILSFGLTGAISRFYYQAADDEARRHYFGSMWAFLILVSGGLTLGLDRLGGLIIGPLLSQIPFDPYIRLSIWTAFLQSAFVLIPLSLLRAREQALAYAGYSLLISGLTLISILVFVIGREAGAAGYIQAQFIAAVALSALAAVWMLRQTRLNLQPRFLRPLLIYSLPLVPHFAAHWALNFSDRVILERYVSLADLGIYSLVYQFGMVMQMIVTAGNNALLPMFSRAAKSPADLAHLPRVITYYVLAIAMVVLAVAMGAGDIVRMLTPAAYHGASPIAVWIVMGYLFVGLYYVPMNVLSQIVGHTLSVPILTFIAAACNIGLNLLLVPRWGVMAAAIDTLIGFVVLLALIFSAAHRRCRISYEYGRIARVLISLGLCLALGHVVLRWQPLINLALIPALTVLMPLILGALGFWTAQERAYMITLRHALAVRWHALRGS